MLTSSDNCRITGSATHAETTSKVLEPYHTEFNGVKSKALIELSK